VERKIIKVTSCLLISIGISSIATVYALYISNSNFYGGVLVWFVAIVSFFGTLLVTLLLRLIYRKLNTRTANIVTIVIVAVIVGALLWHFRYHFNSN
jgi:formate-dependent nitrite reductase membrane component NrfD